MKVEKPTKVVKLKGGMGNQMFQYAFAKLIQNLSCADVKLDYTAFESINDVIRIPKIQKLNISLKPICPNELKYYHKLPYTPYSLNNFYKIKIILEQLINSEYYFEFSCRYKNPSYILQNSYFDGYWQSWKYVSPIKLILKEEFTPKEKLSTAANQIINEIQNTNSVFVGIRRGDYVTSWRTRWEYGSFSEKYYLNAMNYICQHVDNPIFFIFSNDIDWVKCNMNFSHFNIRYREQNQLDDFEEFFLMKSCKHGIIANSTYYWWVAWLIENMNKIIIAPQKWFANGAPISIVPPSWIKFNDSFR